MIANAELDGYCRWRVRQMACGARGGVMFLFRSAQKLATELAEFDNGSALFRRQVARTQHDDVEQTHRLLFCQSQTLLSFSHCPGSLSTFDLASTSVVYQDYSTFQARVHNEKSPETAFSFDERKERFVHPPPQSGTE